MIFDDKGGQSRPPIKLMTSFLNSPLVAVRFQSIFGNYVVQPDIYIDVDIKRN
jgi:hypothetical protein